MLRTNRLQDQAWAQSKLQDTLLKGLQKFKRFKKYKSNSVTLRTQC